MERRVAASEKMLQEIHSVVLELRPTAAAVIADSSVIWRPVARDLATSSSAAAFGSAAQMAASAAIDRGAAMSVPVMLDKVVQEHADPAAPWPQVAELCAPGNAGSHPILLFCLPPTRCPCL